ncbi:hypothetical protein V5O48_001132 [Marasmius crinis-equi]|uniref:Uncharacterized protein n=1 Tax=Marasmius crinis-equi TaxID=585013 RepID=A0ABR3FZE4_9AGAR
MTTFSANTPGRKRTSQTTSSSRRPLTHAAINTNQGARLGTSTLKCDRPSTLPERADAKVRRTRGVSRIQLEDSLSIGTASPPEKRQRIDQGENLIAEQDAVIYAQHWEFVRTPTLPPSPERSRAENKALAMWLGAYLSEMFIADMALRWFVSEALARDLEHTLDFFYPDNVVVFLALKYVVDLLPQTRFDERGRNEADCAIMILRAFLSALSLASKWMDDYAQPLHDW